MSDNPKPILCLDFDGVIHSYTSGWKDATTILDPPVKGSLQFIRAAQKYFRVAIFSTRSAEPGGIKAMCEYLGYWSVDPEYGLPHDTDLSFLSDIEWPSQKPPAFLSIDDRAIQFEGDWSVLDPATLRNFKPWNQRRR
jgi:hypothetical protein